MDNDNLQKLLPFLNHENSIRKAGIIMLIKNCCFELGSILIVLFYISYFVYHIN